MKISCKEPAFSPTAILIESFDEQENFLRMVDIVRDFTDSKLHDPAMVDIRRLANLLEDGVLNPVVEAGG